MKFIPYYENIPVSPPQSACFRVTGNDASLDRLEGTERAWIETTDPRAALAAAELVRRPVLNSVSADEGAWETFGAEALARFDRVVLLPFLPGAASQSFDANLDATLALASRYGVPPERCIVDVCILPRRYVSDPDVYAARIAALRDRGFDACGGVNNYVYADDERLLPAFCARLADAGLAYGIVSARFLPMLTAAR
jgi:hypothetical protein